MRESYQLIATFVLFTTVILSAKVFDTAGAFKNFDCMKNLGY
jgi:hypothetical protein